MSESENVELEIGDEIALARAQRAELRAAELADAKAVDGTGVQAKAWRAWPWQAGDVIGRTVRGVTVRLAAGTPISRHEPSPELATHGVELELAMGEDWRTRLCVKVGLTASERLLVAQALAPEAFGLVAWRPGWLCLPEDVPAPPKVGP